MHAVDEQSPLRFESGNSQKLGPSTLKCQSSGAQTHQILAIRALGKCLAIRSRLPGFGVSEQALSPP